MKDSTVRMTPRNSASPLSLPMAEYPGFTVFVILSRILERQKLLQTDQVLLRRLSLLTSRWFCLSRILRAGPRAWSYQILKGILFAGTPQWKRKRSMLIALRHSPSHQILGPAISEAAEPRCSTPSAIKLPDTPRRSEAPPC
jgi:hypothetical protein